MAIRFSCPSCNTAYTVDDKNAGKKSNCAKCGQVLRVPSPQRSKTIIGEVLPGPLQNKTILGEAIPDTPATPIQPVGSPDTVPVICPTCGHTGEAAAIFAGSIAKCPKCDTSFTIGERALDEGPAVESHHVEQDYRDDYLPAIPRQTRNVGQSLANVGLILGVLGIVVSILSAGPFVCTFCTLGCCPILPLSWLLCAFGGVLGVVGSVLGFMSRNAGDRSNLSTRALVAGVVAVVVSVAGLIITLAFPVALASNPRPPDRPIVPVIKDGDVPSDHRPDTRPDDRLDQTRNPKTPKQPPKSDTTKPPTVTKKDPPKENPPARRTYTRDEFRKLVIGKTPEQVIAAVGQPDSKRELGGAVFWVYRDMTIDPVSKKLDLSINVNFEKGKVVSVD
jgi:predicted Zn finger-like uncharacterized protein